MTTTTPGLGDPYWYEWTVGQVYIVQMLNPDSAIRSVTLQASNVKGFDDVVVVREGKPDLYLQIKHSRAGSRFTFADLVASSGDQPSLLRQLSEGWKAAPPNASREVILFTNRNLGSRRSTARDVSGEKYERPPLDRFWDQISSQLESVAAIDGIVVPQDWQRAWEEFLAELSPIGKPEDRLAFLRSLRIKGSQRSLEEIEREVCELLTLGLGVKAEQAQVLLEKLNHETRIWTTSRRERDEVTLEDLLRALSANAPSSLADHRIPPPEPFFDSRVAFLRNLEGALRSRVAPIVFLTGDPGSGKTSLVSALANRDRPLFAARFHAFRPVQPGDRELPLDVARTTTTDALWGDLLSQLRERMAAEGNLSTHNVPVRNDFLTALEKRDHVLRICSEVARRTDSTVILAIDGIDHAARAGHQNTFLKALVSPEMVPESVCILVAGQDPQAYKSDYPEWLVSSSSLVAVEKVPPIEVRDVLLLVTKSKPDLSEAETEAFARVVVQFARGSTLAAVFGAHECQDAETSTELEQRLENRQLRGGLAEYYSSIWRNAVAELEARVPLISEIIAASFSLSSRRLSGQLFADAFPSEQLGPMTWSAALGRLRPLVVKDDGGYRVFHNDVRVYLTSQLQSEPSQLTVVAEHLADLYLDNEEYEVEKHADGFRFLEITGQHERLVRAVTPRYILEAWALARPVREIEEQSRQAVRSAASLRDWDCFMLALRSCATASQLAGTLEREELRSTDRVDLQVDLLSTLPSEREVRAHKEWDVEALHQVLFDSEALLRGNERDRARGVMRRWLASHSPVSLLRQLGVQVETSHPAQESPHLDDSFREFLAAWGRLSVRLAIRVDLSLDSSSELEADAVAHFTTGYLAACSEHVSPWQWARSLRAISCGFIRDSVEVGWELCRGRRWQHLALLVNWVFQREADHSPVALAQFGAFAVLAGVAVDRVEKLTFEAIEPSEGRTSLRPLVSLGLVRGWIHPEEDPSAILDGAHERCADLDYSANADAQRYGTRMIAIAARLGQLLRSEANGNDVSYAPLPELDLLLVGPPSGAIIVGLPSVVSDLTALCLHCCEAQGGEASRSARSAVETFVGTNPVFRSTGAIWEYLKLVGSDARLLAWAEGVMGRGGCAWSLPWEDRVDVIREFCSLARSSGLRDLAAGAETTMRWASVGYSSHKEYSLGVPLEWFRATGAAGPSERAALGLKLLGVSRAVSDHGDNRMSWEIEEEVAAAVCRCGPQELWRVLNSGHDSNSEAWIRVGSHQLFSALRAAATQGQLNESEQLSLWCYAAGSYWWGDEQDCRELLAVRTALSSSGEHFTSKLDHLFPLESMAPSLPIRRSEGDTHASDSDGVDCEIENQVSDLSIDLNAALALLEQAASEDEAGGSGDVARGIVSFCKRIDSASQTDRPSLVERLLTVLVRTDNRYAWYQTGKQRGVEAIVPFLSEKQVWRLVDHLVSREPSFGISAWLSSVLEDGSSVAVARHRESSGFVLDQVEAFIDMHVLWMEGGGRLPQVVFPERCGDVQTSPQDWHEFFALALFEQLETDSLVEASCALRGLHGLFVARSTLPYTDRILSFHEDARLWLLCLLEKLVVDDHQILKTFAPFIDTCRDSGRASEMLQVWVILRAHERVHGVPHDSAALLDSGSERSEGTLLLQDRLLETIEDESGIDKTIGGNNAVLSRLRFLQVVTGEELDDLESTVALRLASGSKQMPDQRRLRHRSADLVRERSIVSIIGDEVIGAAIGSGRWSHIPTVQLAQALLTTDDPHVLLGPWGFSECIELWPDAERVDGLASLGRMAMSEELENLLTEGLRENEVVLAGSVTVFSRRWDVELSTSHLVRRSGILTNSPGNRTTFNGRSFALHEEDLFQPHGVDPEWLTFSPGGHSHCLGASLTEYPSAIWMRDVRWIPDPRNALRLTLDGQDVAWFEMRWGPPSVRRRKRATRLPKLQRWVCSRDALDDVRERLGVAIVPKSFLRLEPCPEEDRR